MPNTSVIAEIVPVNAGMIFIQDFYCDIFRVRMSCDSSLHEILAFPLVNEDNMSPL